MNIHTLLGMVKNYKWKSVFFSYWLLIALVLSIPVILFSTVFFSYYNKTVREDTVQNVSSAYVGISSELDSLFDHLDLMWIDYNNNNLIQYFLTLETTEPDTMQKAFVFSELTTYLKESFGKESSLISIDLYSPNADYVFSSSGSDYLDGFYRKEMFKTLLEKNFAHKCIYKDSDNSLTVAYKIQTEEPEAPIIAFTVKSPVLTIGEAYGNESAAIYDYNTKCYIEGIGNVLSPQIFKQSDFTSPSSGGVLQRTSYNKKLLTVYTYLPKHSVCLINQTDVKSLSSYNLLSFSYIIVFAIILFILTTALSFFASLKLYSSLANAISDIEISPLVRSGDTNELDFITNNLIELTAVNNSILEELPQKIRQLKNAQTLALQTQISPHFIFNTLNMLSLTVSKITHGDNEATRIIKLLSEILRGSLESSSFITTLDEEILYAKKYIEIEQLKLRGGFSVVWDIDDSCKSFVVAKFILQPIIENSISHGFKLRRSSENMLCISAHPKSKQLIIDVCDNAGGLSYEQADKINASLTGDELKSYPHIGLRNVNQRIMLLFGEQYGLRICKKDEETHVYITLPQKTLEQ